MSLTLNAPDNLGTKTILSCFDSAGIPVNHKISNQYFISSDHSEQSTNYNISFPLKLGLLLDEALKIKHSYQRLPKEIVFKDAAFYPEESLFETSYAAPIILTEKEHDLLIALWQSHPNSMNKDTLLKEIWEYKTDLETHTIETHIYRLRQKIEFDPAKPQILMTDENGYRLNIAE